MRQRLTSASASGRLDRSLALRFLKFGLQLFDLSPEVPDLSIVACRLQIADPPRKLLNLRQFVLGRERVVSFACQGQTRLSKRVDRGRRSISLGHVAQA